MISTPLVSIVLTLFNSEKTVEAVLSSILAQDFPLDKVELIIVDGGSRDRTLEIVNKFLLENSHRFHSMKLIVHDRNYGVSKARNDGIKASRGKYLLILDHDVILSGDTLRKSLEYMESSRKRFAAVIPLHQNLCSDFLARWEYRIRKGKVTKGNAITSCALLRRDLVNEIGFYDETLGPPLTVYEDIEYGARALARGYEVHVVGFIEVLHNTCEEPRENTVISQHNYFAFVERVVKALKSLGDSRYRYALKKYLRSSPGSEKLRWAIYSALMLSAIPLLTLSLLSRSLSPSSIWILLTTLAYLDVLRYYWNGSLPHISIAYSAIAFAWRLFRSVMLLIPGQS